MRPHDVLGLARLSGAILRYLRAHPQAADTVAGIAELFGKNPRLQAGETSALSACFDSVITLITEAGLNS